MSEARIFHGLLKDTNAKLTVVKVTIFRLQTQQSMVRVIIVLGRCAEVDKLYRFR